MSIGPLGVAVVSTLVAAASAPPAAEVINEARPERHAHPALVAERATLQPGAVNRIGITFQIERGWHLYWDGQNDSGFPITAEVVVPEGFTTNEILWPAPERHLAEGEILDHVYHDRVTLIVPVQVPAGASGAVEFKAKLDWLVCKEACVPESAEIALTLPISKTPEKLETESAHAALFKQADARLPRPLPTDGSIAVERSGETVTVRATGAKALAFFPGAGGVTLANPAKEGAAEGSELRFALRPDDGEQPPLVGVLEVVRTSGKPEYFRIGAPPPPAGSK